MNMPPDRKGLGLVDSNRVNSNRIPFAETKLNASKTPIVRQIKQPLIQCKRERPKEITRNNPNSKIVVYKDKKDKKETSSKTTLLDLFRDDDTPIRRLPNDCLLIIFKLCQDTVTLSILSGVSRSWRRLIQQPILWRDTNFRWINFNRQLSLLGRSLRRNPHLEYIRILTITAQPSITLKRDINVLRTTPFGQLETLNAMNMNLGDILFITQWMQNITSLNCENIPVHKSGSVYMPDFSKMHKLNSLKLQFSKHCSLKVSHFTSKPALKTLPTSLRNLEIINLYDEEEDLITPNDVIAVTSFMEGEIMHWSRELLPLQILDTWLKLESRLVSKYTMLSFLSNLTCLSLDRVSAYTTRVWRECLLPCGKNLNFISLQGWSGNRESPQAMMKRRNERLDKKDLDLALSEFISSLSNIKTILLDDFTCTSGFIMGLNQLTIDSNINYAIENNATITEFTDKTLFNFNISIKKMKI